jgi:hypothetical protein
MNKTTSSEERMYDDRYIHSYERDIAKLLDKHDLSFIYRQPTYMYDLDYRPCIASPSFTISTLKDLIVDYSPLYNSFDQDYKKTMYEQNDLDAIVMNRAYFEKDKWEQNLYHDIITITNGQIY